MHAIGAAAKLSGVNIETIRYYEREGVVPAAERSGSGRRLYGAQDIARLRFIRRCRDLGFPISDIKALLDLSEREDTPCDDARDIGERQLDLVRAKLRDLRSMEEALRELIRDCSTGAAECAMLRALFTD